MLHRKLACTASV